MNYLPLPDEAARQVIDAQTILAELTRVKALARQHEGGMYWKQEGAYEYLIKKFADDSGHTAAEFYTNRTVVHLMTRIMGLKPGETAYDPTCGTGGMLLNAVMDLRNEGKEWRSVKLYGQEVNLLTSAIARMNMFLHEIEEFEVLRGDTLAEPKFIEGDQLKQFDVIFFPMFDVLPTPLVKVTSLAATKTASPVAVILRAETIFSPITRTDPEVLIWVVAAGLVVG